MQRWEQQEDKAPFCSAPAAAQHSGTASLCICPASWQGLVPAAGLEGPDLAAEWPHDGSTALLVTALCLASLALRLAENTDRFVTA